MKKFKQALIQIVQIVNFIKNKPQKVIVCLEYLLLCGLLHKQKIFYTKFQWITKVKKDTEPHFSPGRAAHCTQHGTSK